MVSTTQKVWRVSQALGDIAFAYPFTLVLLEIEVHETNGWDADVYHFVIVLLMNR